MMLSGLLANSQQSLQDYGLRGLRIVCGWVVVCEPRQDQAPLPSRFQAVRVVTSVQDWVPIAKAATLPRRIVRSVGRVVSHIWYLSVCLQARKAVLLFSSAASNCAALLPPLLLALLCCAVAEARPVAFRCWQPG